MSKLNIPRGFRSTVSSLASSLTSLDNHNDAEEEYELLTVGKFSDSEQDSTIEEENFSVSDEDEDKENDLFGSQVNKNMLNASLYAVNNVKFLVH